MNKEKALNMLKSQLYQLEIQKRNEKRDEIEAGKIRIDFGSQIRNYVLHPYKLIKDNRTNVERTDVQTFWMVILEILSKPTCYMGRRKHNRY